MVLLCDVFAIKIILKLMKMVEILTTIKILVEYLNFVNKKIYVSRGGTPGHFRILLVNFLEGGGGCPGPPPWVRPWRSEILQTYVK